MATARPSLVKGTIRYGTPVRLDIGGAWLDLGAEYHDGEHRVALAADDGNRAIWFTLSPDEARQLAAELTRLADG